MHRFCMVSMSYEFERRAGVVEYCRCRVHEREERTNVLKQRVLVADILQEAVTPIEVLQWGVAPL